jgi:hypothetical protein
MIYHIKRTYSRKVVMKRIVLILFLSVFPLSSQNWTYVEKNKTECETQYIGHTTKRIYIVTKQRWVSPNMIIGQIKFQNICNSGDYKKELPKLEAQAAYRMYYELKAEYKRITDLFEEEVAAGINKLLEEKD